MALLVDQLIEESFIEVETDGDCAHDFDMEIVTCLVEVQHRPLEVWRIAFFRPVVLPFRIPVASDLYSFLRVGTLCTQLGSLVGVKGLGDTFTTRLNVTPIRFGARPSQFRLEEDTILTEHIETIVTP